MLKRAYRLFSQSRIPVQRKLAHKPSVSIAFIQPANKSLIKIPNYLFVYFKKYNVNQKNTEDLNKDF